MAAHVTKYASRSGVVGNGSTDDTAAINAALTAIATAGGGCFVLDVPNALVSGTILIPGNTIYMHERGCKLTLATNSNCHVLANVNQVGSGYGAIVDENITLIGVTINCNGIVAGSVNQSQYVGGNIANGWIQGIYMAGVRNLGVQDLTLTNQRNFGFMGICIDGCTINNAVVTADLTGQTLPNQTDAIHFIGPSRYINGDGWRLLAGDDAMAFNTEDFASITPLYVGGDITFVSVENVTLLSGCYRAFRLLSNTSLLSQVHLSNFNGTCGLGGIMTAGPVSLDAGNLGKISIENINIDCNLLANSWTVNGVIADIDLTNINGTNSKQFCCIGGGNINTLSVWDTPGMGILALGTITHVYNNSTTDTGPLAAQIPQAAFIYSASHATVVSGKVTALTDQSASANNATKGSTNGPVYTAVDATANNQPTMAFPLGQYMVSGAINLSQPVTHILVFKAGGTAADYRVLMDGDFNRQNFVLFITDGSPHVGSPSAQTAGSSLAAGWHVGVFFASGASSYWEVDGVRQTLGGNPGTGPINNAAIWGADVTGLSPWLGSGAAWELYGAGLSDSAVAYIKRYYAGLYGITLAA